MSQSPVSATAGTRSPLAPAGFPTVAPVPGVTLVGGAIGLKKVPGSRDLLLVRLTAGTAIAGTLTRSRCPSAPVDWCRQHLPGGRVQAIVVNSANANAFTGTAGDLFVGHTVAAAAKLFGCPRGEVFIASTGVIGEPVPPRQIGDSLAGLAKNLSTDAWADAAAAIMTTDTFPKAASRRVELDGKTVTISGIAKGSGMIAPDMATMLSFVFTDAAIAAPALQAMAGRATDRSFNCITVDSDTSTSDTFLLAATGAAGNAEITDHRDKRATAFVNALEALTTDLAQQVVRDGEGARKFITIQVTGAASARAARRIGLSVANSPLFKTAIAGEDANWGRIVMAVGKAGERADRDRLSIAMGAVTITRNGKLEPGYDETPVAAHLRGREIDVAIDVGIGRGRATVWTCDLTHGYISINADYRS